jgi:hypothetical protein
MATKACGGLATLFMFIAAVCVFACGLKTFNLERVSTGNDGVAPSADDSASGYKSVGLSGAFFRCVGYEFNFTASCVSGSTTESFEASAAVRSPCGVYANSKMRRCLPTNKESDTENYDTNPNNDRYGFLVDGSCGTRSSCRSGYTQPTTGAAANFRAIQTCRANPNDGRSEHGVCTYADENALDDGEECFGHYECKSNMCKANSLPSQKKTCVTEAVAPYSLQDESKPCDTTQPGWIAGTATATTQNRLAHHSGCRGTTNGAGNMCAEREDGCYDNICRKHMQNLKTDHRNKIGFTVQQDVAFRECAPWAKYAQLAPVWGLGFNLLLMFFLIPIHTFAPQWFAQTHGGWMIAACVATMVSIYYAHHTYFESTADIIRNMVDCGAPDDLDAAYFLNTKALPAPYVCVNFNSAFSFDDLKKHLGVTQHYNPAAIEFAAMVAGYAAGIIFAMMSLTITVFIQMGGPCLLGSRPNMAEPGKVVQSKGDNVMPVNPPDASQPAGDIANGAAQ